MSGFSKVSGALRASEEEIILDSIKENKKIPSGYFTYNQKISINGIIIEDQEISSCPTNSDENDNMCMIWKDAEKKAYEIKWDFKQELWVLVE